jgi:homopolymeric O-antigen transport system ATP-binding protein
MSSVISVENLSKKYIIDHQKQDRNSTLRDVLSNGARRITNKLRHPFSAEGINSTHEEFWALKGVSFDIQQGDRVGIIGRNGAGKSTLLKILSRITEPTSGKISIKGRVASLLEVGTGFHPELTGRENIFLNGAILGMSKSEIKSKFDEIVAFAEVEKFLDTPVKHYSSGMYVRLAFAVAAHLEPEILIVDEVLAVGDAQFQKKCLEKIESVSNEGRTILFVSHNMGVISNLCQKGIVLDAGRISFHGGMSESVVKYYQSANKNEGQVAKRLEGETAALLGIEIIGLKNSLEVTIHDEIVIRMKYRIKRQVEGLCVPGMHLLMPSGEYAFLSYPEGITIKPPGEYYADCKIPANLLNEGAYFVSVAMGVFYATSRTTEFWDKNALAFNVIDPMDERSNRYGYVGIWPGAVRPRLSWDIGKTQ